MEHLTTRQRLRIRRAAARAADDEGAAAELNVVPLLDILMNVVLFVLGTLAVTFTATIDTKPAMAGVRPPHEPPLALTILIVPEGFAVKARGGNVAPGCGATGEGLTVRGHDFAALTECAARLKRTAPAERSVTLGANPGIPYQLVISTFDALRKEELFPEVSLAIAR